jgi:hypothetical protein
MERKNTFPFVLFFRPPPFLLSFNSFNNLVKVTSLRFEGKSLFGWGEPPLR